MDFRIRWKLRRGVAVWTLFFGVFLVPQHGRGDELPKRVDPIQVEITTHFGDGQSFVEGDTIAFFLSLDTDAHIVAVYEDAERRRVQILPNVNQESNYYRSGIFHPIPGKDAPFRFLVTEPFGTETLYVFASTTPMADLPGDLLDNGLKQLHGDINAIRSLIKAQARAAFGECSLQIRTRPAS
jgi:hypothetical protein